MPTAAMEEGVSTAGRREEEGERRPPKEERRGHVNRRRGGPDPCPRDDLADVTRRHSWIWPPNANTRCSLSRPDCMLGMCGGGESEGTGATM